MLPASDSDLGRAGDKTDTKKRGKERKKGRGRTNEWGVLPPTRLLEPLHARVLRPLAEVRRVVACVVEERGKLSGNRRLRRRPARAPEATQRAGLSPGSAEPARAVRRALRRHRSRPRPNLGRCQGGTLTMLPCATSPRARQCTPQPRLAVSESVGQLVSLSE